MLPRDLLKKVKQIEITTSRLVTDIFAGAYHSAFKGQGIEFDEVREYQYGDDIRTIDWNVTARTGRAHVKKFVEERELTVMILVDASSSHHFASRTALKSTLAGEIAALLALSAIENNDKVGLIFYTDRIEKFIPPRKGKRHVLRLVREILSFEAKGTGTRLELGLEYLNRVTTRKSVTFLLSDFLDDGIQREDDGRLQTIRKALKLSHRRHDMIAIGLHDPMEARLPAVALIEFEDAESGEGCLVDTTSPQVRQQFRQQSEQREMRRQNLFRSVGMDYIPTYTDQPYTDAIIQFFRRRQRIRRHV